MLEQEKKKKKSKLRKQEIESHVRQTSPLLCLPFSLMKLKLIKKRKEIESHESNKGAVERCNSIS